MTLWQAALLGVLQGVTEFLPVSSSGHLALAQMVIPGFHQPGVVFDAMLHVGTAFAILWFERRHIAEWAADPKGRRLIALLALGTVATAAVAFPLRPIAEGAFSRPLWVGVALVLTGLVVGVTRFLPGGSRGELDSGWRQVVTVGLVQGLAIFPGLSRSGMTIAAGLGSGLERSWAARFSFLLSVPAIAGVTVVELARAQTEVGATGYGFFLACIVGAAAAGLTGFIALQLVVKTVSSRIFHRFAWYCIPVGLLVLAFSIGAG